MKMIDQVKAAPALDRLSHKDMPFADAYKLAKELKKVRDNVQFFTDHEQALVDKYAVREDGKIKVDDQGRFPVTDRGAYIKARDDLYNGEVDDIKLELDKPENISADDLLALSEVVTWRES